MPQSPAKELKPPKPESPETYRDERSYHHIIIASCDTRDCLPDHFEIIDAMVSGFIHQRRSPAYIVLLPSHADSMVYETVLPLLRTEMAKKGTVVLSVPMGKGGDISAFGQAIEVLEKEFSEHMSSSFDQAWVTYLNFPGMLHADFCRKVFKSVMMSRWEGSEPTQVILFNSKLEEHEDFGQIHNAVVTGLCAKRFFQSKIFRVLQKQENIYWVGIYVMFCRSPLCLDDQVGVTRYIPWAEEKPILYLGKGERVNFAGQPGCIKMISDQDTTVPKYHVSLEGKDERKMMKLHREEFHPIPRSMRGVHNNLHLERARLYRKRCGEELWGMSEMTCLNLLGNIETAAEAAMALGSLLDQQQVLTEAMQIHLSEHLPDVPRGDIERSIIGTLAETYDEKEVCRELGFPEDTDLETAIKSAERTPNEIKLLVNRAPIIGAINMCRMLGIEPVKWENVLDDGKALPVLYACIVGGKEGTDFAPITVDNIVQQVIKNTELPDKLKPYVTKYCMIYCLSKGCKNLV